MKLILGNGRTISYQEQRKQMVHLGDYHILLESQLGQEGQSIIPIQQIRPGNRFSPVLARLSIDCNFNSAFKPSRLTVSALPLLPFPNLKTSSPEGQYRIGSHSCLNEKANQSYERALPQVGSHLTRRRKVRMLRAHSMPSGFGNRQSVNCQPRYF